MQMRNTTILDILVTFIVWEDFDLIALEDSRDNWRTSISRFFLDLLFERSVYLSR